MVPSQGELQGSPGSGNTGNRASADEDSFRTGSLHLRHVSLLLGKHSADFPPDLCCHKAYPSPPFPIFRKCFQNHGKILLLGVLRFLTKRLLSYDLSDKRSRGIEIAYIKGAHP